MSIVVETLRIFAVLVIFLLGVVLIADFIIGSSTVTGSSIEY